MRIISAAECPQGSDIWWEMRKGRITASGMDRILTAKTRKPSAQQDGYIAELIGDLTCLCPKFFTAQGGPINRFVEYGRQTEAEARRAYEFQTGLSVTEVGMCIADNGLYSCSPDGLVDPDGGFECKCPMQKTHAEYLMKGEVPLDYLAQVHGSLLVTGRKWWDFFSYAPGLPNLLIRVVPDDYTDALRVELEKFCVKYEAVKKKLGVGIVEEPKQDPRVEQAIAAWKEKLAQGPGLCTLNDWLPELAEAPKEAKLTIWTAIKEYGASKGWTFFHDEKVWKEPTPV